MRVTPSFVGFFYQPSDYRNRGDTRAAGAEAQYAGSPGATACFSLGCQQSLDFLFLVVGSRSGVEDRPRSIPRISALEEIPNRIHYFLFCPGNRSKRSVFISPEFHIIQYSSMAYTEILKDNPLRLRTLKLTLPFAIAATQIAFLYIFLDYPSFLIVIGLMIAYILPPAGKETVIPAGIFLGIPWWLMALSIMMIDVETALFMGWNFDLALKIPVLGSLMESFIGKADEFIKERPWVKNFYFTGIVVLVMIPFMGSGGIRGSIIGNLLGMQKIPLFLAIVTGSFIGCFGIALAALFLQEMFMQSILLGIAGVAGIIIVTLTILNYWKRNRTPAQP
jgi:uncharacterized membrane protein